jgi:hypothetical protein
MRRHLAVLLASAGFLAAPAVGVATTHHTPAHTQAVAAKSCRSGYTHAVIGGEQKCLHAGEFCARRYRRQYTRYGYSCTKRDRNGRYHLVEL